MHGLTLNLNRDLQDDTVKAGFRKALLREHTGKDGGSAATTKRLNAAWENQNGARKAKGRPQATSAHAAGCEMCGVPAQKRKKKEFRIQRI